MNDPTSNNLSAALLDQVVAGSFPPGTRYAFVAVIRDDMPRTWGVGIAVENEAGYRPVSSEATEFNWDHFLDAENFVTGMNQHIGLNVMEETKIIVSTMRKANY